MTNITATRPIPFGIRYLISPEERQEPTLSYNDSLQINVSAAGNPWHAVTAELPETRTETSKGDGQGPGSDDGTDIW